VVPRRPPFPLTIGLAGLMLAAGPANAERGWDCHSAPDGRGWQCTTQGQASDEPGDRGLSAPAGTPPPAAQQVPPAPYAAPAGPVADRATAEGVMASDRPAAPPPSAATPAIEDDRAATSTPAATTTPATAGGLSAHQAFGQTEMPELLQPPPVDPAPPSAAAPALSAAQPGPEPLAAAAAPERAAARPVAGGIDAGIDWTTCRIAPQGSGPGSTHLDTTAPIAVSADALVAELGPQQAVFSGHVQLVQDGLYLQADELTLNRVSGEVSAQGNLLLDQPDIRVAGSTASYQLATGQGRVEQASYRLPAMHARGDADSAELLGQGRSRFENISYTTCAPGDADWLLSADTLELDRNEGFGTAHGASLRFLGVPVMYAPVFTFPIDNRRRSGLLVPSVGQSDTTGFDLSLPYYLNLAPNYDLTLTPRIMSKRGLMLGGEFRFLTESSKGTLAAEFLPDDRETDEARGGASLRSYTSLGPQAHANVRLNYVSDNNYLEDFGASLAATSATHLERAGEVIYNARTWDALARVQYYQTIDDAIAPSGRPYSRLPQLALRLRDPDGVAGLSYHLDAEYVNFHREDLVRGHRIDLFPAVSLPLRETWGFVEPKVGARYTAYSLTDQAAGLDDSPSTLSGMLSLDSGLYFDRTTSYFAEAATHTLEPRLYYLFVPYNNQSDQPVFDTGEFDFNFDNLFRENRFNGPDRFADANQLTAALTSRLIADGSGTELLRASLGQTLYFDDREVTLPGADTATEGSSSLVGEIAARLSHGWRGRLGLQWDPHDDNDALQQALAQLNYRDQGGHVFNAAYRLRDGVTEQTDLAIFWPVNEQFTLVGRHNYSLQDNRPLEVLAGLEYGRCCWRLRALVRQYSNTTGDDQTLGFLLQLELNGLGRLGDEIQSTLQRSIYGYGTNDYD